MLPNGKARGEQRTASVNGANQHRLAPIPSLTAAVYGGFHQEIKPILQVEILTYAIGSSAGYVGRIFALDS